MPQRPTPLNPNAAAAAAAFAAQVRAAVDSDRPKDCPRPRAFLDEHGPEGGYALAKHLCEVLCAYVGVGQVPYAAATVTVKHMPGIADTTAKLALDFGQRFFEAYLCQDETKMIKIFALDVGNDGGLVVGGLFNLVAASGLHAAQTAAQR